ncbi:MAG TPA: hypothetical protein ENI76_09530 [Ignavibacteria bacterium]|nr:hypothetical protein [Ignavibacteria bacterium]
MESPNSIISFLKMVESGAKNNDRSETLKYLKRIAYSLDESTEYRIIDLKGPFRVSKPAISRDGSEIIHGSIDNLILRNENFATMVARASGGSDIDSTDGTYFEGSDHQFIIEAFFDHETGNLEDWRLVSIDGVEILNHQSLLEVENFLENYVRENARMLA